MKRSKSLGIVAICMAAFFSFLVMFLSFYPGVVYGPDLEQQLAQATGAIPFNDWHPPFMALIWKLGIAVTGKTSSLFVLEISIFILGLLLISLSGFLTGRFNLFWSLVFVLLPLYAPILIQTGRLWKDQFLTFLLVAAVAVLWMPGKKRRRLGFVVVFLFLASAAMLLRANGIFAVIFLLPLASWKVRQAFFESPNSSARIRSISAKKKKLLSVSCVVVAFLVVTAGYKTVVEVAAEPTATHQIDQLLLDDIVNTASAEEVNTLDISDGFKEYLASAIVDCVDATRHQNLIYDACADDKMVQLKDGTSVFSGIANFHDEFMTAWVHTVPKHLPAYAGYRFEMFSYFIFNTWSPSLGNIAGNFYPKFGSYYKATATYINSMSDRWLPVLFCPGIYLLLNIMTLVGASKIRKMLPQEHFLFGFWLSVASLFWLLSQIPIVPAPDYRYAYLSVVFTMMSSAFLASGLRHGQLIDSEKVANGERHE